MKRRVWSRHAARGLRSQAESAQYTTIGRPGSSTRRASASILRIGRLTAPGRWSSPYSWAGSTSMIWAPCCMRRRTPSRSTSCTIATLHSRWTARGPEPHPTMAAVAERLVLRRAAPAQRNPRVLPKQLAVLAEDPDLAADEQRPVGVLLHRGLLRHRLLRPAVPTAEVQRSRRAALDHLTDLVRGSVIDDDPGPPLVVEHR